MKLYDYQIQIAELIQSGKNIILQAPTGAGKTFAALWPFLEAWDRDKDNFVPQKCIYSVPMRVLANQFLAEYDTIVNEKMILAYPPKIARQTGEYKEDAEFRADMTFATIDQVLSGWLMAPYSLPRRLGNLNAGAFVGSYLVFDEFHLFDPDSTLPVTLQMLKTLNGISPFILMTATFSKEMLESLAHHLDAEPFLLTEAMLKEIPAQRKDRRFYTAAVPMTIKGDDKVVHANETAVSHILTTHQAQPQDKPRTLVVCNQVERAQAIYQSLSQQKPEDVTVRLLHSRFLQADRQATETFIRQEFNKDGAKQTVSSLIVVATQVVEVGLDMSCAVLHTELAPAASILQRAGRCARYPDQSGKVHIYPLPEKEFAPYHGKRAKQQCELAWKWLQANQDRHLTFADEQALINFAHTVTDQEMIQSVFETEFHWQKDVQAAWRGEKSRGETAVMIRNIQAVSIVVHSDPDQLKENPFKSDSFSLHPGTLQGKFEQWQITNDDRVDGFDEGHLDWLVQKLIEDENDEDVQGNRPVNYSFKDVKSKHELYAPLLVINPALVGYSKALGLTLNGGDYYESAVPKTAVSQQRTFYHYKLESYFRHIELVHQSFKRDSLTLFAEAARRLEQAYGWQAGIITQMAHLVMVVHDIGKLSTGWQNWATAWQAAIGRPIENAGYAAAHTDYDPTNEKHQEHNRRLRGKRPSHAVESALAALPILQSIVAFDIETYRPLLRAAFTVVARHHAPFSSQPSSYQLVANHAQLIQSTMPLLPPQIQTICQQTQAQSTINTGTLSTDILKQILLIDARNEQDVCCYMLLVRALRTADQKGTSLGSH